MTEQELKKSIEKIVEEILAKPASTEEKSEAVEKAMPTSLAANGGKDEIKSGAPMSEEQKMMDSKKEDEAKKAEEKSEEDEKKEKEAKEKAEKDKMKKAEADDEEEKEEKEEAKKAKKMKKSIEELSEHLESDELELIKAWREESEEGLEKSEAAEKEDMIKSLTKVMDDQLGGFKKALDEKDTLIKALTEKVEKMATQPAYDRRSISTLETLEKSETQNTDISKTKVLDTMLEMQRQEQGVNSHHIAEFEATNNISDTLVKSLVFKKLGIK